MSNAENVMNTTHGQTFYRGWWITAVAFLGVALSYATVGVLLFGMLIGSLSEEFGWQRAEVSFGLTLYTSIFVLLSVPMGRLMDRIGVRKVLLPSIALLGISMSCMVFMSSSLWHFYGMYLLLGVFSVGTIPSGYTRVILNWFDAKRGIALAIALAGVGAGAVVLPPMVGWIIASFGWRGVYLGITALLLFVCLPIVALFLKEQPSAAERVMEPGFKASGSARASMELQQGFSIAEALHKQSFLLMVTAFILLGVGTIGMMTHYFSLLVDRQVTLEKAALALSAAGAATVAGRLVCGYLLDRFFAPHVAVLFLVCPVIGILLIIGSDSYPIMVLGIVLLGIGGGAEFDLMSYLSSRYLGLKNYAQIYGVMFAGFYTGGGASVWLVGRIYDQFGSYHIGLWGLAGAFTIAVFLISRLGPYPSWGAIEGSEQVENPNTGS